MYHDEWYCSHWLRCGLCQKEREELKERLKQLQVSHVLRLAVKKRRVAELQNDINKAQFWHRTYDENTMALMVERLPFVTTNPYFIAANCHAALTLELAKLVMRMCVSGSNSMDLERMLGEFHQGSFFSELKEYLQRGTCGPRTRRDRSPWWPASSLSPAAAQRVATLCIPQHVLSPQRPCTCTSIAFARIF